MRKCRLTMRFSATERFPEIDYGVRMAVRRAVAATLRHENFPYPAQVSVTFTSPEKIRGLNARYRGIDRPTDVLSFPLYEDGRFDSVECREGAVLGDIVISVPRACEQARELGHTLAHEIAFLSVHSTLHLLGYDHERSPEDEEEQCRIQREVVAALPIADRM